MAGMKTNRRSFLEICGALYAWITGRAGKRWCGQAGDEPIYFVHAESVEAALGELPRIGETYFPEGTVRAINLVQQSGNLWRAEVEYC